MDTGHGLVGRTKKGRQGMQPNKKWTNGSKVLASQRHHTLQSVCGGVGMVYELPKIWPCSLSPPKFDASPLLRRSFVAMT